ncbi:non-muscle caldesmon isoform X2 [Lampris incognitus]|uniref:non-muscle caldesmon isoform X2 n=1 Tax=Lampris incognitus TaxID=2546036 RepID=UPI0024B595E1|nr:non-muscle caldesmon isoform X2 [Lampris incognitus]
MSSAILRRNSSKQGLQNLMRVTAQRSVEDAEEVERERRRRAREAIRRMDSGSGPGESSQENGTPAEDSLCDSSLKPSSPLSLEEDEGFSDWTQRREKRRQQRMQEELSQGAEEEEEERLNRPILSPVTSSSFSSSSSIFPNRRQREQGELERARMESEKRRQHEEEVFRADRGRRETQREEEEEQMNVTSRREEDQQPDTEVEKRRDLKVSYTSKVFLQQEAKHSSTNGDGSGEEVTSHTNHKTRRPASRVVVQAAEPAEAEAILETEQRLEKIRRSHQEKESQELEQLRHRQVAAEQELGELKQRREERRRIREEEERRREEEEQLRLAKEEEKRRQMKEDIEKRRMEAAERMKTLSTSSVDGDETFSPLSPKGPAQKITERTESLNRSLKKSNSFRKMLPPVLLSKIDDRLEQYAHAVEETKAAKQGPVDIPNPPEAITTKKNLFEAGEAWSQSPTKGTPCKDAEGLKVGVAGLITQWVKGSPESSGKQPAGRPADVRPGDVMQKKNMWEIIGDTSGRPVQRAKGTATSKRYKFIVTGHGKYEKISVDDEHGEEFSNGKSDPYQCDY